MKKTILCLFVLTGLMMGLNPSLAKPEGNFNPRIAPPQSSPEGQSYSEWVAAFWKWALEFPLDGLHSHPFLDDPNFDFSYRQSGNVWFWSAPDGPLTRSVTLPAGKSLFLTLRDVECSSLEDPPFHGDTEEERRHCAKFFAEHILNVFCIIDGVPVQNLSAYRFLSPEFEFTAPDPWIFGPAGAGEAGKSVGDGYYLMLYPMSAGKHTIHYGGTFHFDAAEALALFGYDAGPLDLPKDITIELTVQGGK